MKQLIIFRHGKAEQDTMAKDDYDRALTERGRRNASDMGAFILKKTGVPDLILTSSAKRAHETAFDAKIAVNQLILIRFPFWFIRNNH